MKPIAKALEISNTLAKSLEIPMIVTSFLVDAGAGLNLKCYAHGLSTREINDLAMMSATGIVNASRITKVKFRNINNQDCVVLDNCPDVLSVGQLVAQGYDFLWLSDPANKQHRNYEVPFDANLALAGNPNEVAYLVTPYGNKIHLTIHNRVPYYNDENADLASEADYELSVDSLDADADEVAHNSNFPVSSLPAHRIMKKSTIELTDHQQELLDHAVSRRLMKNEDDHDILHLYSHKNCTLCREVKQRRNYSKPVPIEKPNLVTKAFHKTDVDHIIMGNHTPGILGEPVG